MQIVYSCLIIILFGIMVLSLQFLQQKNIADGEVTRKIGHFILGVIFLPIPIVFKDVAYPITTCLIISIIIYLMSKKNRLQCADNIKRASHGTYFFPIGVACTIFISNSLDKTYLFYPSILVLTISDIAAAFIGQKLLTINVEILDHWNKSLILRFSKSLYGSIAFLFATFLILELYFTDATIIDIIVASVITTFVEFVSRKGSDNITIPLSVLLCTYTLCL